MFSLSTIGREAFANFFHAMVVYKAHWYSIILPSNAMASDDLHSSAFPSLSTLTSIKESMLQKILLQCRLVQYRRGIGYSPLLTAWQEFFTEYELDEVKVTYYSS
jgi:hypothetical protein